MYNKFKVKKKLISIALALALASQPLTTLPMNVFAGTGKDGYIALPTFELDKIIELKAGEKFDLATHVKDITPKSTTASFVVESQTAFRGDAVLDAGGNVVGSGFAKVKVNVGGVSKETYIIANINGTLNAAYAGDDYKVAHGSAEPDYITAAYISAFNSAGSAAQYATWANSYKTLVDGVVHAIVADYKTCTNEQQKKKDWLNGAYAAVKAAKKMADGKGIDLEAKLKIIYMAYRIAQFTLTYYTSDAHKEAKAGDCKKRADALQEVIDKVYSDPVGDIEAQAAMATETTNDPEE